MADRLDLEAVKARHEARLQWVTDPRLPPLAQDMAALISEVEALREALTELSDCQPLPKLYKYTGTDPLDVENMFDVGHRHTNGKKPYDYLMSWLSMLRPFAYATKDDSWGEMEKLLSIVMRNYVRTLVKAEAARAVLPETETEEK